MPSVRDSVPSGMNRMFGLIATAVVVIAAIFVITGTLAFIDAKDIVVIQYPNGHLSVYKQPGVVGKFWGHTTTYKKQSQYWFSNKSDQGNKLDQSILMRFNDGGHGNLSGSISWNMPMDDKSIIDLHVRYGSQEAVEQRLVRTVVEKSVYMTGPLMSSRESYNERRNELIRDIEDQIKNGVYRTQTVEAKMPDPITGEMKSVQVVKIVQDGTGLARQEDSPLSRFGIGTFNLSINNLAYEDAVEKQIKEQQQMTMAVQTAIAEARKAEQAAITAEKNGEAEAAKAKWAQEVIKAREVTLAQQHLAVNTLEAQAAAQMKQKMILEGEGEGAKRRAIIAGDNALDKRLDTWLKAQQYYADAIKGYQGNWVPSIVTGGATGTTNGSQLLEFMGINAARQLSLDMNMAAGESKAKK